MDALSIRASDRNLPRAMPSGNKIASLCALVLNKFFLLRGPMKQIRMRGVQIVCKFAPCGWRDRDRERHSERERDTQRERHRETHTERQRERERERHTERDTQRETQRDTERGVEGKEMLLLFFLRNTLTRSRGENMDVNVSPIGSEMFPV